MSLLYLSLALLLAGCAMWAFSQFMRGAGNPEPAGGAAVDSHAILLAAVGATAVQPERRLDDRTLDDMLMLRETGYRIDHLCQLVHAGYDALEPPERQAYRDYLASALDLRRATTRRQRA